MSTTAEREKNRPEIPRPVIGRTPDGKSYFLSWLISTSGVAPDSDESKRNEEAATGGQTDGHS